MTPAMMSCAERLRVVSGKAGEAQICSNDVVDDASNLQEVYRLIHCAQGWPRHSARADIRRKADGLRIELIARPIKTVDLPLRIVFDVFDNKALGISFVYVASR